MSDEILLRFLSGGLINVGGDDAKLDKLRGTVTDLANSLKKNPSKAASFALVAFDAATPSSDPVVQEAVDLLNKRWPTYVNTFSGVPVAVIRAMLLDALTQAARDEDRIGVAFVTSARNVLPFTEVGTERTLWGDVVNEIERRLDARAESEWATPSSIAVPPLELPTIPTINSTISSKRVAKDVLQQKIAAATGPQSRGGPTSGNPQWPTSPQPWANEFSDRLTETLTQTIDAAVASVSIPPIDFATPLQQLSSAVSEHVQEAIGAFGGATAGLQRRTNLLWWKEALFSPSAQISYRQLPVWLAAPLMALDLHQQVPVFSPASVSAFLGEAVMSLPTADDQQRSIFELLTETRTSPELLPLRNVAAELFAVPAGRGPLLAFVGHPDATSTNERSGFRDLVGVPPDTGVTSPAWALWIFRELQAARATSEGAVSKRRTRRG